MSVPFAVPALYSGDMDTSNLRQRQVFGVPQPSSEIYDRVGGEVLLGAQESTGRPCLSL